MGYTSGSVTNVTLHEIEYRKQKTYCITVGFVSAIDLKSNQLIDFLKVMGSI